MYEAFKEINRIEFLTEVKLRFNNIEVGFKTFKNNILSINKNKLNFFEENKQDKFKIEYEERFIEFIKKAYRLNNDKGLIIDFYISNLDTEAVDKILKNLDAQEGMEFLGILEKMSGNTNYFKIENEEILDIIIKLNIREIFFSTFYFLDKELTIWGNYNMEFPVFYNNDEIINEYKKIALNLDLYIR